MMSGTTEVTEATAVVQRVTSEETYEFLWKIPNWNVIQNDRILRREQKFVIKTGSGGEVSSEWNGGIQNYSRDKYGIYCRLVDVSVPDSKMEVRFVAELRRSMAFGGGPLWTDEHYGIVSVGHSFDVRERWKPKVDWTEFLDPETNAASIYIKLTVLNPVNPVVRTNQASKVRLACDGFAEQSLATLLKSNFRDDLTIVCRDGKQLKCHRDILQKTSVFEKMLDHKSGFTEFSTGIINVTDVGSQTMELVLHYLYTGDLLSTWKDPELVVEFSYAANKYGLSKILEYLDNTLEFPEAEEIPSAHHLLVLLDVAIQSGLRKAENRIRKELMRLAVSKLADCEGSWEVVEFFGGDK